MEANKNAVLMALAEEWGIHDVKEDEFTRNELDAMLKEVGSEISPAHIQRKLKALVTDGVLTSRSARIPGGGGRCNAYKPAEGKTWEDVLQYIKVK